MSKKDFDCSDKIRRDLIVGFIVVIAVIIAGDFISYNKTKAKIYHTHFMEREIMEKVHNADISLDRSKGHMVVEKKISQ